MRVGIAEIEIDFSADQIIDNNMLARRTKPHRALVLENVTGVLKFFQVTLVEFGAFALQIRSEISATGRAFVPIKPEPLQPFVDCRHAFFDVPRSISIFDAQHEFAAVMAREEPIEQRGARATDVQKAGGRGGETDADFAGHWLSS